MKYASSAYQAILAAGGFQLADLWQITLVDGTLLYYTTYDRNIAFNGQTYTSTPPGLLVRSDITQKRGVEPSEITLVINYNNQAIDAGLNIGQSIVAQRWRGAIVTLYRALNPMILPNGSASVGEAPIIFLGRVTQIKVDRSQARITVQTPSELFNQEMPWRLFSPQCRWTLFDVGCGLNKANYAVNGTVLAGSTASNILTNGLLINPLSPVNPGAAPTSGYFDTGVLRWTSGKNIGLSATIASYLGAGLANSYDNLVLGSNPLAYYKLDGIEDTSSVIVDYSGNGYNAQNNNIAFSGASGPVAAAAGYSVFNGATSFANLVATGGSYNPVPIPYNQNGYLGGVSFEMFVNVTIAGQPNGLFNSGTVGTGNSQYPGALAGGGGNANYSVPLWKWGTFHPVASYDVPAFGQWFHMVAIFRGSRYIDVYLNGYLSVTVEDRGPAGGATSYVWTNVTLGKEVPIIGTTFWFEGNLSRFAIYPRPLSPTEILSHYNASLINPINQPYQQLQLVLPAQSIPQPGDSFTVWPGCDKSLTNCVDLSNVGSSYPGNAFLRYGGTPNTPVTDSAT